MQQPFIPERDQFYTNARNGRGGGAAFEQLVITQRNDGTFALSNSFGQRMMTRIMPDGTPVIAFQPQGGPGTGTPASMVASTLAKVRQWQIQGNQNLLYWIISGDLVIREGATTQEILDGIADVVGKQAGGKAAFTHSLVDTAVIVVSGKANPPATAPSGPIIPVIPTTPGFLPGTHTFKFNRTIPASQLATILTTAGGILCVDETQPSPQITVNFEVVVSNDGKIFDPVMDVLTQALADRTGLTFRREQRKIDVWTLDPAK